MGINMTLWLALVLARLAASIRVLWANIGILRCTFAAMRRSRAQSESERLLSDATDRFELERRERAWTRRHPEDGSLLGH